MKRLKVAADQPAHTASPTPPLDPATEADVVDQAASEAIDTEAEAEAEADALGALLAFDDSDLESG